MAIEITGLPASQLQESSGSKQTQTPQDDVNRTQQASAKPATADQVTLTKEAEKLQKLEKELSKLPVVDQERVNSLRKAIASGEYKIDSARVAEKFMQFESALPK